MKFDSLLSRISRGKEEETIRLLRDHAKVVCETGMQLKPLINALYEKDGKTLAEGREKVDGLEHEADVLRRKIEETLYSGAFLPLSKSRILDYAEAMDDVADKVQDIARLSEFMEDVKISGELYELLQKHADLTVECIAHLKDAFKNIEDPKSEREIIQRVREKEHEADLIENKIFRMIYEGEHPPKDLILLSKFVEYQGAVSNKAEDASDALSMIALMHKP